MLGPRLINGFITHGEVLEGFHQGLDLCKLCSKDFDRSSRVVEGRVTKLDDLTECHRVTIQKDSIRLFFETVDGTLGW